MSLRVDTTPLITGSLVVGDTGHGVFGSQIPSSGDNGAGLAYASLTLPADADKEIRAHITVWPTSGTLFVYEDTSFTFVGPDGTHTFEWQLYVDGVATGSPEMVTVVVGEADSANLNIHNSSHAHSSTGLVLGSLVGLMIHSCSHALTSTNLSIASGLELVISNSVHSHISDGIGLTTSIVLAIQNASHSVSFDSVTLSTAVDLAIHSAIHALRSSNVDIYDFLASQEELRDAVYVKLLEFGLIDQQTVIRSMSEEAVLVQTISNYQAAIQTVQ